MFKNHVNVCPRVTKNPELIKLTVPKWVGIARKSSRLCVEQQTQSINAATMGSPLQPPQREPDMQQKTWSAKRDRQYAHIKDSLLKSGRPQSEAQEIAARVVNKERAQHGESVTASASSINDMSAGRRGGSRSHQGSGGRTVLQLRNEASQRGLKGRSSMNKSQLEAALA